MKSSVNSIISLLFIIALSGCNTPIKKANDIKASDTAALTQNTNLLNFQAPEVIDSSQYVIYPLIKEKSTEENYGSSSSGRAATYWNLVFYNPSTKEYHLLDTSKMILSSYNNGGTSSTDDKATGKMGFADKFIFYSVIKTDFNKDNTLDEDDPKYLYISDKSGYNFKQISPDNLSVTGWYAVKGTSKVIIHTIKDSNNDKKFDQDDEQVPFVYDLAKGGKAEQIFSKDFKENTKKLYEKLWHK